MLPALQLALSPCYVFYDSNLLFGSSCLLSEAVSLHSEIFCSASATVGHFWLPASHTRVLGFGSTRGSVDEPKRSRVVSVAILVRHLYIYDLFPLSTLIV